MLKIYNTLTRKKEVFRPVNSGSVGLYTCGPTVYDIAHIGNLRTYIFEDLLRRTLEFLGYRVRHVMNITDVEDKIIKKAKANKQTIQEITKPYTKEFLRDIRELNIESAHYYPTATSHVREMVKFIVGLKEKSFAYEGKDGSVYFDISKFKPYGRLVGLKKIKVRDGARVDADEYGKDEARDFVLWKAKKGDEPGWKSPWGEGRPGWHIECSVMSMKYLGKTFDIHTGGVDNIFPHHENEIAQSEAATGQKFVNYWVHGEHLLVNSEKMAKRSGNFYTLRDIKERGLLPNAFRYLALSAHYRSKLNFTWRSLEGADNAIWNLWRELGRVKFMGNREPIRTKNRKINEYRKVFRAAIEDDLDTPKALSILRRIITDTEIDSAAKRSLSFEMDKVFGLNLHYSDELAKIPLRVRTLAVSRELMRRNQQFVKADGLRNKVKSLGYDIEDTSCGPFIWPNRKLKSHPKI
ncbi:MAG: cysteine--tRNA ligase [Candidatus Colwellbacteria bacterium]|nr:cysteine--tRNA ligase [Candidatus Colwellbacteria bacterium]